MNPKKEFVKAIMSVLRLEQNIYTIAAIEEMIDRVETKDYTMFIAYIGERDSDFEKPIQSIAKAVDEFYEKKNKPTLNRINNAKDAIVKAVFGSDHKVSETQDRNIENLSAQLAKVKSVTIKEWNSEFNIHSDKKMSIESIMGYIVRLGGFTEISRLFYEDKDKFPYVIEKMLGAEKYKLPSISEKIDNNATDSIDSNILMAIGDATRRITA